MKISVTAAEGNPYNDSIMSLTLDIPCVHCVCESKFAPLSSGQKKLSEESWQVKKNPKIRVDGLVKPRLGFFLCVFLCMLKKLDTGVAGWGLANQFFFLT